MLWRLAMLTSTLFGYEWFDLGMDAVPLIPATTAEKRYDSLVPGSVARLVLYGKSFRQGGKTTRLIRWDFCSSC